MERMTNTERAILLGLIPLLGATTTLFAGLAAAAISLTVVLIVFLVDRGLRAAGVAGALSGVRWALAAAAALSSSWLLSRVAPWLLPLPSGAGLALALVGATPIVFAPIAEGASLRSSTADIARYVGILLAISVVREYLGNGSIGGLLVPPHFVIPMGLFNGPIGAFALPATLVLAVRIASHLQKPAAEGEPA